jgi:hypothetical protein
MTHTGKVLIGIGAAKSGTTWLFQNLRSHPQMHAMPLKELHYFDQLHGENQFPGRFHEAELILHTREKEEANDPFVKAQTDWLRKYIAPVTLDDRWYVSLLEGASDRVPLDISPGYAVMSERGFSHMKSLLPNAQVVFMMRNPMERAWSQFRKDVFERTTKPMTNAHMMDILDWSVFAERSNYTETIRRLDNAFDDAHVTYAFYEDVFANPLGFLSGLCRSLGVDFAPSLFPHTDARSNISRNLAIPSEVGAHLVRRYARVCESVEARFGRVPPSWSESVRRNT